MVTIYRELTEERRRAIVAEVRREDPGALVLATYETGGWEVIVEEQGGYNK